MEQKDRYIFLEFLFTFFLLNSVILLFGQALAGYELYLAPGLIGGFFFSWFIRNKQINLIKIIINIGIVGVFVWMLYYIGSALWLYTDIVLMLVKGVIFLEIILSFNSCSAVFLTYMQVLSLPLFMGSPLFIKNYNEIHAVFVLIYLICWAAIFRLKFYEFFKPVWEKKLKKRRSFFISAVFFLIILAFSWILFFLILGKFRPEGEGAFIYKEGKGILKDESIEKEYYDSQDKIQGEMAELIDALEKQEDKDAIVAILNSLITGQNISEIRKSELALIDYLKRLGPGLEKGEAEEIIAHIKEYLDAKTLCSIKMTKDKIFFVLVKNAFSITERIIILTKVTDIRYSNFYAQVRQNENQIQKIIDKSSVNIYAKKDLKKLITELKAWKALEIYRKKIAAIKKKIDFLDEPLRKEFIKLYKDLEQAESSFDLEKIGNKIKILKHTMPPRTQSIIKDAEEILDIMLDFIIPEEVKGIQQKIDISNLPIEKKLVIEKALDNIKNKEDYQQFLEESFPSEAKAEKEKIPVVQDAQKKLVLIKIIPDYLKIPLGKKGKLIAYGVYSDDSQEDLTFIAAWSSTFINIASVAAGRVSTHSVGETTVYAELGGIKSFPATVIVDEPELVSIVLSPENSTISMKQKLNLKAEGYYTDGAYRDITSLVAWEFYKPRSRIVSVEKGLVRPRRIGKTQVYALYSKIRSNPANIKVIIILEWLLWTIFKIVSILILVIIIIFTILRFLTKREKDKIKNFLAGNPREFIVKVYENARKILLIFGLRHKGFLPPVAYGRFVEKSYFIENKLFFNFTVKFAEAKYSSHILQLADATSALNDYNNFLEILFSRYNKFSLFYKYCLSLLQKRPLFIK